MSIDLATLPQQLTHKHHKHRPQWRRGVRAMRALIDDAESTELAFEVSFALDGDVYAIRLDRVLAHPEGRKLCFDRPELAPVVADRDALARLPEESFGRAYLDYLDRNSFDPVALAKRRQAVDPVTDRDPTAAWFAARMDLLHDLWHVLTGYGTDGAGEAALLAFSLAQYGGRSNALLTVGAGLECWQRLGDRRWPAYVMQAWRRGRAAAPLDVLRYEELLPLPLAAVRTAVGIDPPEVAHPDGLFETSSQESAA